MPQLATGERVPSGKQQDVEWLIEATLHWEEVFSWGRLTDDISITQRCFIPEVCSLGHHPTFASWVCTQEEEDQLGNVRKGEIPPLYVRVDGDAAGTPSSFTLCPHCSILFVNSVTNGRKKHLMIVEWFPSPISFGLDGKPMIWEG